MHGRAFTADMGFEWLSIRTFDIPRFPKLA